MFYRIFSIVSSWFVTLLLLAAFLFIEGPYLFKNSSDWFVVSEVIIEDSLLAEDVVLNFNRQVISPFYAEWVVTLKRFVNKEIFESVCTSEGSGAFDTNQTLPNPTTLSWWITPDCEAKLEPGTYTVNIVWNIYPDNEDSQSRRIMRESNFFVIGNEEKR